MKLLGRIAPLGLFVCVGALVVILMNLAFRRLGQTAYFSMWSRCRRSAVQFGGGQGS